ncbi:MAG: NAD-dependent epimerase/dehydratase family protein [Actinomycetota bacterium]|nr:NAD-dependent epimerase/dehydratase family protein [Actinomycetota bacterium]
MEAARTDGLTVAVTGPTGDIGRPLISALERVDDIATVRGMARRPFDAAAQGWTKTTYVRGDMMDRAAVEELVRGADVVVHLAFIVFGGHDETWRVNVEGTRNVFEATVAAGARRLVYASSVAAYGFNDDARLPLTEDEPLRPTRKYDYSEQKAQNEGMLAEIADGRLDTYVLRPCIVGGPESLALLDDNPYIRIGHQMPDGLMRGLGRFRRLKPVVPDAGEAVQLVHADDVADAIVAAVLGRGRPGAYNIAGDGTVSLTDIARELGWYPVNVPRRAMVTAARGVAALPKAPAEIQFFTNLVQRSVAMDTSKARTELGWQPRHRAEEVLRQTVAAARARDGS